MCSSTYYMAQNGKCLKYTSVDSIYKLFNIKYVKPSHKTMRTSTLTVFNNSVIVSGQKETEKAFRYTKYLTCLNPGEIPCWKGCSKCYNITSLCIYQVTPDTNLIPCENGRHLERCEQFSCDIIFKCLNNYCISWSYVCDGKWDCPRGDDELVSVMCNNNTACRNMYHCRGTGHMCLQIGNICDGHKDCPFGDDELFCELKTVYCPHVCTCLLYAIDCRGNTDENIEEIYLEIFLSIYLADFKLNSAIILKLKYAVIGNLPQNKISDICDTLTKVTDWKFILLDLSYNLLTSIKDKCFPAIKLLKSLAIDNNNIIFLGKYSFFNLSHLNFLSLRNNPISQLTP